MKLNSRDAARDWYRKALAIADDLVSENDTLDNRQYQLMCYFSLGDGEFRFGRLQEAEKWFDAAVSAARYLADKDGSLKTYTNLIYALNRRGNVEKKRGYEQDADMWYKAAERIRAERKEKFGTE